MMKFSVLISVYYKENAVFFTQALLSLVQQTLIPTEIVLVKDGPLTKELDNVIEDFLIKYPGLFQIISIEKNMGLGNALKIGLEHCKYDWVARMDTDDICLKDRFEKQIAFLEQNPHIDVLGSNMEEFNKEPGDLKSYRVIPQNGRKLLAYSKFRSPVNHPTIVFKKQAVLSNGNYNGNILLFEDYTLFVKMLKNNCQFYNLQEPLLYFRVGNGVDIIKRRSGFRYLRNELKFLNFAHKIGHLSSAEKTIHLLTRIPLRFMPPKFVRFIYNTFLRKQKNRKVLSYFMIFINS